MVVGTRVNKWVTLPHVDSDVNLKANYGETNTHIRSQNTNGHNAVGLFNILRKLHVAGIQLNNQRSDEKLNGRIAVAIKLQYTSYKSSENDTVAWQS